MIEELINLLRDEKNINEVLLYLEQIDKCEIGKIVSMGDKTTWKNTMEAFSILGFDTWKYAISEMFTLLQDLNWPGALESRELLASVSLDEYKKELNIAVKKAVDTDDVEWAVELIGFIIDNCVLDLLNTDAKDKLKKIFLNTVINLQ